ncbi:hypothetical protein DTO164E3_8275 [Paecilomyces variotii]|nr:hypothetical protein DTO164E3_8275 [Paecilomyces variotii]KAJ9225086.1 hypothetical protein DTO169C6_2427 [Paecilomyces variotii]KAJ9247290.1 hypothetical protein DTO207G8_8169 [Paecilomyces variotii]KAJ9249971.1 hypothetical protein DTO195F2_8341 [Paecilomyces variotii]KAJ9291501.1 hypothetical protein DTO021C3_858 [Paecilomyces variotii]
MFLLSPNASLQDYIDLPTNCSLIRSIDTFIPQHWFPFTWISQLTRPNLSWILPCGTGHLLVSAHVFPYGHILLVI